MNQARAITPTRFFQSSARPMWSALSGRWSTPRLVNVLVCVLLLSIPVVGLSIRYAMSILIVIVGPMQLLRAIPYDIRLFIAMRGRTCFTLLQLVSFSMECGVASKRIEVVTESGGLFESVGSVESVAPMRQQARRKAARWNAHWRVDNGPRSNVLQHL
jgi:hypothetical protein